MLLLVVQYRELFRFVQLFSSSCAHLDAFLFNLLSRLPSHFLLLVDLIFPVIIVVHKRNKTGTKLFTQI
jgi:hypothetical protein